MAIDGGSGGQQWWAGASQVDLRSVAPTTQPAQECDRVGNVQSPAEFEAVRGRILKVLETITTTPLLTFGRHFRGDFLRSGPNKINDGQYRYRLSRAFGL